MSTRSLIGIVNPDGTCQTIYCHWDGYPDYNGKLLLEHYSTPEKVKALLELGNISSLNEEIAIPSGIEHTFDNPASGVTVAYHRDRGEELTPAETWDSKEILAKKAHQHCWAEYVYLFENNQWFYCITLGKDKYHYLPLKEYNFTEQD